MRAKESEDTNHEMRGRVVAIEIWLGFILFVASTLQIVLERFGYGLELRDALALLPLLTMFLGVVLIGAGTCLGRYPEHPVTCHLPLVLWLLVILLTLI